MDYEKKYKEALDRAKDWGEGKALPAEATTEDILKYIFPELADSVDERIRKWLYDYISNCPNNNFAFYGGVGKDAVLNYLEKQKAKEDLDRMAPIYEDLESFESALEKAWKFYNDSGARTVDSCEDNYIECAFSKGFREGFLYKEKQKEQNLTDAEIKESMDAVTNFKVFAADLAKTFNITHKRDIDWHNFCAGLLTYLERNKPAEWSEVELEFRGEKVKVKRPFHRDDKGRGYSTTEQDEDVAWYALRAWCEKKGVSLYDLYPRAELDEEYVKGYKQYVKGYEDGEKEAEQRGYERGYAKGYEDGQRAAMWEHLAPPPTIPSIPSPYQPFTPPVEPYYWDRVTCTTTSDNVSFIQTNNEEHHEEEQ